MKKLLFRGLLPLVLALLLIGVSSCAQIAEEEETETETADEAEVTEEIVPSEEDSHSVVDAMLDLLLSEHTAICAAYGEDASPTEQDYIARNPAAFAEITALGAEAYPYLCEIGAGYREAYADYAADGGLAYARCMLAYAAAQAIDETTFNRAYASPDGVHILYQTPEVLWGMGDPYERVLYDVFLADAKGNILAKTQGCSSLACIDWTEDGRYAVVSDRLTDGRQLALTTVFDTVRRAAVGLPYREVFDAVAEQYGSQYVTMDTYYLSSVSEDVLRIWLGTNMTDGQRIVGHYDYDLSAGAITAMEYAPFDPNADGAVIARALDVPDTGTALQYLMTDTTIYRLEVEVKEDWSRTLYINKAPALTDFLFLDDFRVIDNDYLAVVTGGTDVQSQHLYLFDRTGNLLFETYYLTDKGMIFNGILSVEEDRILMHGSRGYHGPSLLVRDQEQILTGAYADSLYCDPIPDILGDGSVTANSFGEVPLYPDRASVDPDLNPDLVFEGVYALPFENGQVGQIELAETTQTLGAFLDALYGAAVLTAADTVNAYLDRLADGADGLWRESDIIAQNPDAFDALVSLGADVLPYLQDAAKDVPAMIADEESMKRMQRASLAMMAAYTIDPSLYDLSVSLPDGKRAVTAKIGTFMAQDYGGARVNGYDRLVMTDLETGEGLAVHSFAEDLTNVTLECSPGGQYVVYQWGIGSQHGFMTGGVFDTVWGWLQPFPTKEAFLAVLCPMVTELLDVTSADVVGFCQTVSSWTEDGEPVITFDFRVGIRMGVTGTYRFEPKSGGIYDIHAHINQFQTQ